MSHPQKFSTEGRRAVIFRRKYKQFAKIDAKLVTVGMDSNLLYTSMNIIINKRTQLVHRNLNISSKPDID